MPRAPRIEYPGATYHVMARGDRREPIVHSDQDCECFVKTLGQVCQRTGWEVFAWVLMRNHYHLAFRTPEPNLVAGMSWFQNTFTRRINASNQLWGHLFGGRYKSILVENDWNVGSRKRSDYLATLVNYVHLNPARARLVDGRETSALDYRWSSIASGYGKPPSKRPRWLCVEEGLGLFGERDNAAGRRRYVEGLDSIIRAEGEESGLCENPGQATLQSSLRRGWYWGSQEFREKLIEEFGANLSVESDRELKSSGLFRGHSERSAAEILKLAEKHYGATIVEMSKKLYGDLRRVSVAWAISRNTMVRQKVIAEMLGLKTAANVSQRVRQFEKIESCNLDKEVKKWKEKVLKIVC